jgi:2-polyprenyl-6-methoxyphenol hydroxylase-like FAD-dependent oxidoreductase
MPTGRAWSACARAWETGPPQVLSADLVVDTSGRGSRTPRWLEELGYAPPAESTVKVGIGYVTREYRAVPGALRGGKQAAFTMPDAPRLRRGGALLPIEGGRWIATLCGWLGDHAPMDDVGFLDYVRGLAAPDIHDALEVAEPVTEFQAHKFPAAQRRHYEGLRRFPAGYLVMGDAIASFNPVYGQGMTVSACQAEALDACLREASSTVGSPNLARRFFQRAAGPVDAAWMLSTGEDFRFPEVEGRRPPGTRLISWYGECMQRATLRDEEVTRAFYRVMTMTQSPASIFAPTLAWRILGRRGGQTANGGIPMPAA